MDWPLHKLLLLQTQDQALQDYGLGLTSCLMVVLGGHWSQTIGHIIKKVSQLSEVSIVLLQSNLFTNNVCVIKSFYCKVEPLH